MGKRLAIGGETASFPVYVINVNRQHWLRL